MTPSRTPLRRLAPAARKEFLVAILLTLMALLSLVSGAGAQQAQSGTPLPPVTIEPPQPQAPQAAPAPPQAVPAQAPAATPAPKRQAQPKRPPNPRPQTAATAPPPAPAPVEPASLTAPQQVIDGRPVQQTTAGPVDGYRALTQSTGTRTDTPLSQTPQAIVVVPGTVLQDQRANDTREALRNVSGVVPQSSVQIPAYDGTIIRGFTDFYSRTWVDGLPVSYGAGDLGSAINVERIEVLKGPSGMLYGGGVGNPVGGVVNIVTKVPEAERFGKVGVTFGSHQHLRTFFDVNEPANPYMQMRITGDYQTNRSHIDVLDRESWNINPSFRFTDNDGTVLTVQTRFSRFNQQEFQGLPAVGTVAGNFRIRPDLFIGPSDIPLSYSNHDGITVSLDRKLGSTWNMQLKGRVSQSRFEENAQAIFGESPDVPPSSWFLFNTKLHQEQQDQFLSGQLTGRFNYAGVKNTLLLAGDYSNQRDKGYIKFAFASFLPVDLANPNPGFPAWFDPHNGVPDLFVRTTTAGLSAQMQTSFWDRLHLIGSLRLAHLDQTYTDQTAGQSSSVSETRLLPRIGAIVDVTSSISLFAAYSESMRSAPFVLFAAGSTPEAEINKQVEGGVKFNFANQLSGSLVVFDIERENVAVFLGGFSAATGQERSRGFEADVIWQVGPALKLLGNYAYTDAFFTKDVSAFVVAGNKRGGVPEHSGRVWVNYAFQEALLKGLSVGAGVYASAGKFVDNTNQFKSDAFYTVDAKVAYETKTWEAALAVKNLTDNKYFDRYGYFDGRVWQPPGVTLFGTFAVKY